MLHVKVVAVGRIRERYLQEGCSEYLKRLGGYARVEVVELKEELAGPVGVRVAAEARRIEAAIPARAFLVALDERGRQLSSVELADYLEQATVAGHSEICFVIGGADGLDPAIRSRAHLLLSFSKFTFPHQLFRLMLLEQLYRAFTIQRGEPYHRAGIAGFDGSSGS